MNRLFALGAGVLVTASLPPWGWWPLTFIGLAVFADLVERRSGSRRERFILGTAFGIGWLAPGMGWMWFLTPPGYLVAVIGFAALHGVAALVVPAGGSWSPIARASAHTLAEALRFVVPFGGVPLASVAIAQSSGPLLGIARIAGAVGVTWATLAIGFSLGTRVTTGLRITRRVPIVTILSVVVIASIGALAPDGVGDPSGEAEVRVAVVQGGGPQGTSAIDTNPREVFERHLDATRTIQPGDEVELVVWPENVISVGSVLFENSVERGEIAAEAARLGIPFSVGITERPEPGRFLNAQVIVLPDGSISSRYDKVRRVPFGEYIPLRGLLEALGAPVDRVPTDAIAGTGPAYLDAPFGRLAVAISWEIFFGGRARDGTTKGGAVLLNPTNGASYTGTILQTQQVASSRLRAVETGRFVVQAAPTGFSAFIDQRGKVLERTGVSERKVIFGSIPLRSGSTVYARLGDVPVVLALLAAFAVTVVVPAVVTRRRRSRE